MWFLYIIQCRDGTFYTGIAKDLERRIKEHNGSVLGARYTRGRRPVKLVFSRRYVSRSEALKAEFKIKKLSRKRKIELIEGL